MTTVDVGSTQLLSWPLSEETPAYGGGESLRIERLSSIEEGDSANTLKLHFPNHLGTHIDAPLHFFDGGLDLGAYSPESWLFPNAVLMDVRVGDGVLITPEHLPFPIPERADLILLRTGHELKRSDPEYWGRGPGLSSALAEYLRSSHPSVRAVGVDLISITTRLQREAGRVAHRAFLDPRARGEPIMLIEDMALRGAPDPLGIVLVSPLFFDGADGAPVTVWSLGGKRWRQ